MITFYTRVLILTDLTKLIFDRFYEVVCIMFTLYNVVRNEHATYIIILVLHNASKDMLPTGSSHLSKSIIGDVIRIPVGMNRVNFECTIYRIFHLPHKHFVTVNIIK